MPRIIFIDKHIRSRQGHNLEYCLRAIKSFTDIGWGSIIVSSTEFKETIPGTEVYPFLEFVSAAAEGGGIGALVKAVRRWWRNSRTILENILIYSRLGRVAAFILDLKAAFIVRNIKAQPREIVVPLQPVVGRGGILSGREVRRLFSIPRRIATRITAKFQRERAFVRETIRRLRPQFVNAPAMATCISHALTKIDVTLDDVIIFTTFTRNDLETLLCLAKAKRSLKPCRSWNVIFREPLLRCEIQQLQLDAEHRMMRTQMLKLAKLGLKINYWTDTAELAQQYNLLAAADFGVLPIIMPQEITDIAVRRSAIPVPTIPKFGYIGDARQEKGYGLLPDMIERINDHGFGEIKATFLIQSNYNVAGGYPLTRAARLKLIFHSDLGVELVEDILGSREYLGLLEKLDAVLVAYRHPSYVIGSSGILVEAVAAGTPVVVTEYTWGGRQIREADAYVTYIKDFVRRYSIDGEGKPALTCGLISHEIAFEFPTGMSHIAIHAAFGLPSVGDVMRIDVEQFDAQGVSLQTKRHYYSGIKSEAIALWELACNTTRILIRPFRLNLAVSQENCTLSLYCCDASGAGSVPLGVIGVLIDEPQDMECDVSDFVRGVRELIEHYPHYRATAIAHSHEWSARHSGKNLVAALVGSGASSTPL